MELVYLYSALGVAALVILVYNLIALKREERGAGVR